jgi:hypothetical protein
MRLSQDALLYSLYFRAKRAAAQFKELQKE